MIEERSREVLLSLQGYVTVMACPGVGKSSLLEDLGVPYRPEPTHDIETLGMYLSKTEYSQVIFDRFQKLDSQPGPFWRDSDFFTSLGIFKSSGAMVDAVDKLPNLIVSDYVIWLNLPLEETVRQIIKRNRRSAMMEIQNASVRFERARGLINYHPAKNKVVMVRNESGDWRIQSMIKNVD